MKKKYVANFCLLSIVYSSETTWGNTYIDGVLIGPPSYISILYNIYNTLQYIQTAMQVMVGIITFVAVFGQHAANLRLACTISIFSKVILFVLKVPSSH